MRRHLNTLYVTSEGAYVAKDGQNVVVSADGEELGRVPVHLLGAIVSFARVGMSPALMGFCAEQGVAVSFLSPNGKFLARVTGPVSGNVLLRRAQYRLSDDPDGAARLASAVVVGKTLNQRSVLRRALRDHGQTLPVSHREAMGEAERRLTDIARRARRPADLESLRGLEGEAGRTYFAVFDHLILTDDARLGFRGRSRRPPLDPVNALLSFLYALLVHDCAAAIEGVGLDPAVGFLHRDRPGRPSLALDLMEEFRPVVADRLTLSLLNRRQLGIADFVWKESGAVTLTERSRKAVLVAYQERKKDELQHGFLQEKAPLGLMPHLQALLLARHLRGDLDGYPPFLWK